MLSKHEKASTLRDRFLLYCFLEIDSVTQGVKKKHVNVFFNISYLLIIITSDSYTALHIRYC